MLEFVGRLMRPYRGTLLVILSAMFVETVMNLAGPLAAQNHPGQCR